MPAWSSSPKRRPSRPATSLGHLQRPVGGDHARNADDDAVDERRVERGHELTHIRNGDVRLLVIAVIIAGVIAFFAELVLLS